MSNILFYFYSSFLIIETDESTSNPNMVDVGCQTDLTWKDMESQAQYLQSVTAQLADLKEKLLDIQITEQLCWRDVFLMGVADHISRKRLKGRNPVPWMNGQIINLIKKKETTRQKLKRSPTSEYLRKKFKGMRSKVKCLI